MGEIATLESVVLTIDAQAIHRYAELTGDFNPIHVDPEFAAKTELRGVIAHGTLSLNLIWQSLAATLGTDRLLAMDLSVRFKAPARIGDRLEAGGRQTDAGYDVYVRNQLGVDIIAGIVTVRQRP